MSKYHNLGTVIWFEFTRTVKKPSFWAATLSFPILIGFLFAIIFYNNEQTEHKSEQLAEEQFSIIYKDESGVISPEIASGIKAQKVEDKAAAIEQVKSQQVEAFFYFPQDLTKQTTEIYGKDAGLFNNDKYSTVAKQLLTLSANAKINDPQLVYLAQGTVKTDTTTYQADGQEAAGWMKAIPPLIFLVIFYLSIVMLGSNLLNSTVEEKENRVTEMILTTLNPTVLITGKLTSTLLAGLVQAVVIIVPVVIGFLLLNSSSSSGLGLSNIGDMVGQLVVDPMQMLVGFLIFVGGVLLFAGSLMALGAIMPTAKEAGQWFSVVIIGMFVPFYIMTLILSDPSQPIVQIFTFFPLTAPVTGMMRNAFGSLDATSAAILITMSIVLGMLIIRLAVHMFRYGAMQYDSKLSLRAIFKR